MGIRGVYVKLGEGVIVAGLLGLLQMTRKMRKALQVIPMTVIMFQVEVKILKSLLWKKGARHVLVEMLKWVRVINPCEPKARGQLWDHMGHSQ